MMVNSDAVTADRIQFGFTIMFDYLFPIITMGLGFFIAWLSTRYLLQIMVAAARRVLSYKSQAARLWV